MSQPAGPGSGTLEVKFVPDEEVLKHIVDDAGTAGRGAAPSPAQSAGRGVRAAAAPPGREPFSSTRGS